MKRTATTIATLAATLITAAAANAATPAGFHGNSQPQGFHGISQPQHATVNRLHARSAV